MYSWNHGHSDSVNGDTCGATYTYTSPSAIFKCQMQLYKLYDNILMTIVLFSIISKKHLTRNSCFTTFLNFLLSPTNSVPFWPKYCTWENHDIWKIMQFWWSQFPKASMNVKGKCTFGTSCLREMGRSNAFVTWLTERM